MTPSQTNQQHIDRNNKFFAGWRLQNQSFVARAAGQSHQNVELPLWVSIALPSTVLTLGLGLLIPGIINNNVGLLSGGSVTLFFGLIFSISLCSRLGICCAPDPESPLQQPSLNTEYSALPNRSTATDNQWKDDIILYFLKIVKYGILPLGVAGSATMLAFGTIAMQNDPYNFGKSIGLIIAGSMFLCLSMCCCATVTATALCCPSPESNSRPSC